MVRGNLQQMNTMDLFQSLELGHKSCRLTVSNGGARCDMYFNDGQINHALCGGLRGDEAVFNVLTWSDGQFEIDFSASSSEHTTTRSTQSLLMEGWVSPRLRVKFQMAGTDLELYGPDGRKFATYPELHHQRDCARREADQQTTPILRIGQALDQADRLEAIDPVCHRPR